MTNKKRRNKRKLTGRDCFIAGIKAANEFWSLKLDGIIEDLLTTKEDAKESLVQFERQQKDKH